MQISKWFEDWSEALEFASMFQRAFGDNDGAGTYSFVTKKPLEIEFFDYPTMEEHTVFKTRFKINRVHNGFDCEGGNQFVPAENGHLKIRFIVG